MKKRLFSVMAIVLATAASSFTIWKEKPVQTLYSFQYSGPATASISDVQNEDNYSFIGQNQPNCPGLQEMACRVHVSAAYVSGTTLLSTANISAVVSNGTSAEIIGVNGGTFSNQEE